MADRYAEHVASSRTTKIHADDPSTSADGDLFAGLVDDERDDEDLQSAFIGRMERSRIYGTVVRPYADSRGRQYDLINRQMKNMYCKFVLKGGWDVEKLLTALIVIMRTGREINRWNLAKIGAIYDKGDIPMGALKGVSEKDFRYVATDATTTENGGKRR